MPDLPIKVVLTAVTVIEDGDSVNSSISLKSFRVSNDVLLRTFTKPPGLKARRLFFDHTCNQSVDSADLSHLALQVVLQADFSDQFDLGFQKINVLFGVVQYALQQVT